MVMIEMTIAQQARALAHNRTRQPPNTAISVFAEERVRLAATAVPGGVVGVGTTIDDRTLLDPHGAQTTVYDALGGHISVVVFYRGAWCPYCNLALATYRAQLLPELEHRGVNLVAISPQTPDGSLTTRDKNELRSTVLSDPGNALAGQLGLVVAPAPDVIAAQPQLGLDLPSANAEGTTAIPMPTTLIVDARRVVRWVGVYPDYSSRSEVADILAALGCMRS
ncbi:peroxiredoxin-like family protein [Actinoallomurus oryzae]|uniref:thioredoxin-dependent peroxiredoxin n=2 Tax=Actinoallomurus oryzae TaxID=502180 RepID=A0ABP8R8B2_9ACTN